jgi:hypothetical protein
MSGRSVSKAARLNPLNGFLFGHAVGSSGTVQLVVKLDGWRPNATAQSQNIDGERGAVEQVVALVVTSL